MQVFSLLSLVSSHFSQNSCTFAEISPPSHEKTQNPAFLQDFVLSQGFCVFARTLCFRRAFAFLQDFVFSQGLCAFAGLLRFRRDFVLSQSFALPHGPKCMVLRQAAQPTYASAGFLPALRPLLFPHDHELPFVCPR